jgi:hypothetical protein
MDPSQVPHAVSIAYYSLFHKPVSERWVIPSGAKAHFLLVSCGAPEQFAEKLAYRPQGLNPSQKRRLYGSAGSAAPPKIEFFSTVQARPFQESFSNVL